MAGNRFWGTKVTQIHSISFTPLHSKSARRRKARGGSNPSISAKRLTPYGVSLFYIKDSGIPKPEGLAGTDTNNNGLPYFHCWRKHYQIHFLCFYQQHLTAVAGMMYNKKMAASVITYVESTNPMVFPHCLQEPTAEWLFGTPEAICSLKIV